jgi:protein tyrosine/serine phosphatase
MILGTGNTLSRLPDRTGKISSASETGASADASPSGTGNGVPVAPAAAESAPRRRLDWRTLWRKVKRVTHGWRLGAMERTPAWARRRFGPLFCYFDMLVIDHGVFRMFYVNRHRLGTRAWRSAQPAPYHIRALKRRGLRTIVNLRGENPCGAYWLEQMVCERKGIKLINFKIRSREAPTREQIRAARDLFAQVEYPMLMHCKSGADRVGLMSVLYRFFQEGVPIEEAKSELSLRYGHIRQADTGVLDRVFEKYLEDNKRQPMPFLEWVDTVYDPVALKRDFRAAGWARRLVDHVLKRE